MSVSVDTYLLVLPCGTVLRLARCPVLAIPCCQEVSGIQHMSYRIIWHHSGARLTVKLEASRFPGVLRGPRYVRPGKKSHLRDLFLVSRGKQGQEGLGTAGMGDGCTTCYFGCPS